MNQHAVSEGTKAVTKFLGFEGGRQSKAARAGYSTSVPRAAALHSPDHRTTLPPTHRTHPPQAAVPGGLLSPLPQGEDQAQGRQGYAPHPLYTLLSPKMLPFACLLTV